MKENTCADKQIISFREHLNINQYVKDKPCPWCIKICILYGQSEKVNGFFANQEKSTELNQVTLKEYGQGTAVVLHSARKSPADGHMLYFDNYFYLYQLLIVLNN